MWQKGLDADAEFAFALPLADLLVTGFIVIVCAVQGWRLDRTWLAFGAAFILLGVADNYYVISSITDGWAPGRLLDLLYAVAILLVGWAAWQPRGPRADVDPTGLRVLAFPVGSALVAVLIGIYDQVAGLSDVTRVLDSATLLAVVARLAFTFDSYRSILAASRTEALTDELPGWATAAACSTTSTVAARLAGPVRASPSSTSTASRATTTRSATPRATRCSPASARQLVAAVGDGGRAYRIGGDEFCVLARVDAATAEASLARAFAALCESGEGFAITTAYGTACCPTRPATAQVALRLADQRMYARKSGAAAAVGGPDARRAVRVLNEREPDLHDHVLDVGQLARAVGAPRAARPRSSTDRARRRAARRRQDRGARRDPAQAGPAGRRRVGQHAPPHDGRRADPARASPRCAASPRSCARATSAGTAPATRTASPARRSRSARGSSRSATRSTRWSTDRPYRAGMPPESALGRAAPLRRARSSIPPSSTAFLELTETAPERGLAARIQPGALPY